MALSYEEDGSACIIVHDLKNGASLQHGWLRTSLFPNQYALKYTILPENIAE